MRIAVGLALLIACGSSGDREAAARREAERAASKRDRDAAEVRAGRAMAEVRVSGAAFQQMDLAYKRLDALDAQTERARNDVAAAKTRAQREAASARLRELDAEIRAVTEAKAAIVPAMEAEKRRLAALPASCFLAPTPECRLPKELADDSAAPASASGSGDRSVLDTSAAEE